jgi:hypothetical protein
MYRVTPVKVLLFEPSGVTVVWLVPLGCGLE